MIEEIGIAAMMIGLPLAVGSILLIYWTWSAHHWARKTYEEVKKLNQPMGPIESSDKEHPTDGMWFCGAFWCGHRNTRDANECVKCGKNKPGNVKEK